MTTTRASLVVLALALAALPAAATVYKLVDKKGNVTYSSERPPASFQGEVTVVDTDTALVVPAEAPATPATVPAPPTRRVAPTKSASIRSDIAVARAQAVAARRAFENLRDNPGPEDWISHPPLPSGATRAPSPAYLERLTALEQDALEAERRVTQLEGRAR